MDRKRKHELRDLNLRAWDGDKDLFPVASSLDAALKKNTAFIKRLRTGISPSTQNSLLGEIRTLSLQKYLSEIISATAEGLVRLKTAGEIAAGVEVVSALHQRFGPAEFTKQLAWLLGKGLGAPDRAQIKSWTQEVRDREEKERLARHRVLLKVVTDFWLVGILRGLDDVERPEDAVGAKGKDSGEVKAGRGADGPSKAKVILSGLRGEANQNHDTEPFPLEVLKELLGHDKEHANLPLAVLFVKTFAWDVLGLKLGGDEARKSVAANGATIPDVKGDALVDTSADESATASELPEDEIPIVMLNLRTRFMSILVRYLDDVKAHVVRDQKTLNNQNRRNAEAYVKSGEIFEDRQANFERQTKALDKLIANTQTLCDALGEEMPNLAEKETTDSSLVTIVGLVKTGEYLRGAGEGAGIWEDEDERRFYENLIDLKGRVPSMLLEDAKKAKIDDEQVGKKTSHKDEEANVPPSTNGATASEPDEQSTAIANKTVGAQVDALLTRLPELQTKESVDQIAEDFCFVNSKASRNRLIKSVQEVPKGRTDLLPLYGRLVATLGQYMPDIVQALISHLDEEFRSLQRRKSRDFLGQVRMLNIRYLAELTKFGVVPEHVIFHCFKVCLDDLSRMNVEITASLLENCGRYLLRNPETSPRMTTFMETLGRKKSGINLGQQERMLIENALYYVDPPQRAAIQQKEHTPMDAFIRQLVYLDMTKRNYMKILKTIRKLHWEEPEVVDILEKIFSKPGKVKFSNVHLLAVLLGALYRYHQDFTIGVVDNVLENITLGLEQNDFRFNQRRIAEVKYLGELYNYKMVDSGVIFDTLYRIVTFGHDGTPMPGKSNGFDLSDDFFRIRLVCTILDTCGICFDRGNSRKRLDFFLTFFQYYLTTKDPHPMDIEFVVHDTFALVRSQWKVVTDLAEAGKVFQEAVQVNYKQEAQDKPTEILDEADESVSEEELEDGALPDAEEAQSSTDENEVINGEDHITPEEGDSEEEHIVVTRPEEQLDPEAEADFDREFEKMMAESLDSRKFERKSMFDLPLPIRKLQRDKSEVIDDEDEAPEVEAPPTNTMAFSLMTKKGNRQQTRTIELPSDSHFAVSMKSQQAAEREEQQRIKSLVLRYDLHDENDQHDGTKDDPWLLSSRGIFNEPLLDGNPNTKGLKLGPESHHGGSNRSRRTKPQARKLNLNDVDSMMYAKTSKKAKSPTEEYGQTQNSLGAFVKPTKAQRESKKKPS